MASMRKKKLPLRQKILKELRNLHLLKKSIFLKKLYKRSLKKQKLNDNLQRMKMNKKILRARQRMKKKLQKRKRPMMILKKMKRKKRLKTMVKMKKRKMKKKLMIKLGKKLKRIDGLVFRSIPYYQLDDDNGYICACLCLSCNQLFPFLFKNKSIYQSIVNYKL